MKELPEDPIRNRDFAWSVEKDENGFYYWYDWQGNPYGPFDDEDIAYISLDEYAYWYDTYIE